MQCKCCFWGFDKVSVFLKCKAAFENFLMLVSVTGKASNASVDLQMLSLISLSLIALALLRMKLSQSGLNPNQSVCHLIVLTATWWQKASNTLQTRRVDDQ